MSTEHIKAIDKRLSIIESHIQKMRGELRSLIDPYAPAERKKEPSGRDDSNPGYGPQDR